MAAARNNAAAIDIPQGGISISTLKTRKKKAHFQQKLLLLCCGIIVLLLILIAAMIFVPLPEKGDNTIMTEMGTTQKVVPNGVMISGVNVGGLTEEEAIQQVEAAAVNTICDEVTVNYRAHSLIISRQESDVHWDVSNAVKSALNGSNVQKLEIAVNRNFLNEKLTRFFEDNGGIYFPSSYWLEGDRPIDISEAGQTLVFQNGSEGYLIDVQEIADQVILAFGSGVDTVFVEEQEEIKIPSPLDLNAVYAQVCDAPINPDLDRRTLEVIPGQDGYGFYPEDAAPLLDQLEPGETLRIPMKPIAPKMSEEDVWFQDTLGYCKTIYKDNENRNENLRIACAKLDGLILKPGDVLSYNQLLGQRTRQAGYLPAPAYSGTELVDEIGGGICQVSSTLYLSSLFAELKVLERRNHGYPAGYIPLGLDATVNWGTTDLKLRNDYELPVKIRAEVSDGCVKVRIMGVEQRDYYVKMEYRVDDPTYASAYRCRYSKDTNELVSRKLDHTSIYLDEVNCEPGYAMSDWDPT